MNKLVLMLVLAGSVALLLGCDEAALTADVAETESMPPREREANAGIQVLPFEGSVAPVVTFADPAGPSVGTSWLMRTHKGIAFRLNAHDLTPGTAVTLWAVLFNHPEQCTPPECGEDDLEKADVMPDIVYAGGSLVGRSGRATFAGQRKAGDTEDSLWELFGFPAYGLIDAKKAEVHFIIRDHGPIIPGLQREMTQTFNGGCVPEDMPDDPRFGTPGPNSCADIQFAAHLP